MNNTISLIDGLEQKYDNWLKAKDLPYYQYLKNEDFSNHLKKSIDNKSYKNDGICNHLSHLEILRKAKALAAQIQVNFSFGDRVLLLYPSGLQYVVAFYACIYAGVIAVPSFPPGNRRRWSRFDALFKNAEPALILTTEDSRDNIVNWQSEKLSGVKIPIITTDSININQEKEWIRPDCTQDTIAFLQYSSGSTGTPKGVMVSHSNILHNIHAIREGFDLSSTDIGISWLPIYHDMGLIGSVLLPIELGINLYLMSPLDVMQKPMRWLQAISELNATASGGPNFIYEHCINRISEEEKATLDLSQWRVAFNGAEPINTSTLNNFQQAFSKSKLSRFAITPCYGMAETTLMVSCKPPSQKFKTLPSPEVNKDGHAKVNLTSSGRAHKDYYVKIVNPNTQLEMASEEIGEIWINGPSVAQGYWRQPELSRQTFEANLISNDKPYLRTGDLGFIKDQELVVTGRIKELIIIRGQNYYPQDIERSVAECSPAFKSNSGAAFSVEIDGTERLVVAHEINHHRLEEYTVQKIVASAKRAVAEHHQLQLHALILIRPTSLQRTTSGKIQRVAMKQAYLANQLNVLESWSANNNRKDIQHQANDHLNPKQQDIALWMQQWIAKRAHLPLADINIDQEFVTYGLDSVDAVSLTHDLENTYSSSVKADLAWTYPTIRAAAVYLEKMLSSNSLPSKKAEQEEKWLEGEI